MVIVFIFYLFFNMKFLICFENFATMSYDNKKNLIIIMHFCNADMQCRVICSPKEKDSQRTFIK